MLIYIFLDILFRKTLLIFLKYSSVSKFIKLTIACKVILYYYINLSMLYMMKWVIIIGVYFMPASNANSGQI